MKKGQKGAVNHDTLYRAYLTLQSMGESTPRKLTLKNDLTDHRKT